MKAKHPARYTDKFIPVFAEILKDCKNVIDPFGGTGKLALIKNHGFKGLITCCEIEKEWANDSEHDVDKWIIGDSQKMDWCSDNQFEAICTSPTYGNRMADHFEAKDTSKRITYRHYLGRKLSENNSGKMQWGEKYKTLHKKVYLECWRILKDGGLFVLNISNHIRKGEEINVCQWHIDCLKVLGFHVIDTINIKTPRNKFGSNGNKRVEFEKIITFRLYKQYRSLIQSTINPDSTT